MLFKEMIALAILVLPGVGNLSADATPDLVETKTISLKGVNGKLDHLDVDIRGQRLFVANKPNHTLDIVDLKTGTLLKQIPDQGKVSGVSYAADLDLIYVGNGVGTCNAFDGRDYHQVFSTKAAGADNVHYHAAKQRVYVGQDEVLAALDAKTGEILAEIPLPGSVHGFSIDPSGKKIYAVLTSASVIAVIDLDKHEVSATFPLTLSDAGSPIAEDAEQGLLFVGCPKKKPMVVVFDAITGKEIASLVIPAGIDDLHFDAKSGRLYASCSDSALIVIEKVAGEYKIVEKKETPKDSRTCLWSEGVIYLAVPKQEGKEGPEIRIFTAQSASTKP